MIAVHIVGGLGNQLFQYACGRAVAYKNNTDFKIEIFSCEADKLSHHNYYRLGDFNIKENFATADEVSKLPVLKEIGPPKNSNSQIPEQIDNVLLWGYWQLGDYYFADIAHIIREEFTPRNPFGRTAEFWKQKILAADCAVSIHIRHGDFLTPLIRDHFGVLPLDYYTSCINQLKQDYPNLSVFVFSDDLQWAKNNFKLDVPTEFVEGCEKDVEELFLISYCKHNISANRSTFSWWGAWLNQNPDKKVFVPYDTRNPVESDAFVKNLPSNFINVPIDYTKQGHLDFPPMISIILYVEDGISDKLTLESILNQQFPDYELIIIDATNDKKISLGTGASKVSFNLTPQ